MVKDEDGIEQVRSTGRLWFDPLMATEVLDETIAKGCNTRVISAYEVKGKFRHCRGPRSWGMPASSTEILLSNAVGETEINSKGSLGEALEQDVASEQDRSVTTNNQPSG